MAVDHAGFRRMQRRDAGKLRFELHRGGRIDDHDAFDLVDLCLLEDRLEPFDLARLRRHHELAALAMRYPMRSTELVQHAAAARAVVRAPRSGWIVEARVNHLAVARGNAAADARCCL